jgi:hypothetical protein
LLEVRIRLCLRKSRLFVLQSGPSRFVGQNELFPAQLLSEAGRKIIQKGLHLEAIQWPCNTPSDGEDILTTQYPHSERMQGGPTNLLAPSNSHVDEFTVEIFGGNFREGHGENTCRRDIAFEQARNASF